MTENEAIEVLIDFDKQVTAKADGAYQSTIGKMACKVAITSLEEIQKYRALGTVEELREVVEKQMAKKPHPYIAFDGIERNGCPNCFEKDRRNEILYAGQKYCSKCGQKIDWS